MSLCVEVYGSQAAQLVFGIVPMLMITGMIEGLFSSNPSVPEPLKDLVGTGLLMRLVVKTYALAN